MPARAQFGAGLSLQSEQRLRGVPTSDGKPRAQLSLGYDGSGGWYGGALLGRVQFGPQRRSPLAQAYLGRVLALRPGLDCEAGIVHTRFPELRDYDYSEAYAGLIAERWNARLHYSPHYYGLGRRSLYVELNAHWPLATAWLAFVHLGALHSETAGYYRNPHGATRLDLRTGLALRHGRAEFQLAWAGADRGGPGYPGRGAAPRGAFVLGTQLSF